MIDSSSTLRQDGRDATSVAVRCLSLPLGAVGLEWLISGIDKAASRFHELMPAYSANLQQQKVFLPGLRFMAKFPHQAAIFATILEIAMGIGLVWAAVVLWRRPSLFWERIAGTSILLSTLLGAAIWLMDGRAPFWVDTSTNGYQSGWTVEFFLFVISLALAIGLSIAAPEASPTRILSARTRNKGQRSERTVR